VRRTSRTEILALPRQQDRAEDHEDGTQEQRMMLSAAN